MFSPIHDDEYRKFTPARLAELKDEKLDHLRATDMLSAGDAGDPEMQAKLMAIAEEYFKKFVRWREGKKGKCINCNYQLTGQLFGGAFEWGLAHGEGHCGVCGYPARAIHRIEGVGTLSNYVLQYHPDGLDFDKKEKSDAQTQPVRDDGDAPSSVG